MLRLSTRVLLFLLAFSVSLSSLYFEYVLGLQPCSLCIMQRVCFFFLTLTFICWCFSKSPRGHCIAFLLGLFFSMSGFYFAARQMYIQLSPGGRAISCGPDLNTLLQYFPLKDTVHALFYGSGECGLVTWRFLELSMSTWSTMLFAFIILALLGSLLLDRQQRKV